MNLKGKLRLLLLSVRYRKREKRFHQAISEVKTKKAILFSELSREKKDGLRDIYFTHAGIGDQLLLLAAAKIYFKKTGRKLLVAGRTPELFLEEDDVVFFDLCSSAFLEEYAVKTRGDLISYSQERFRLNFISGSNFVANAESYRIQFCRTHLLANYLKKIGLSGSVDISECRLDLGKDQSVALKERYVCLISTGLQPYKTLPFSLTQEVVVRLSKNYRVVQLGLKKDPLLEGVLDLRGRLNFSQVAQYLRNAVAFVGPQGGLMHLAYFVGCPSVIAVSGEPLEYTAYSRNINIKSSFSCDLCDNLEINPMHDHCPFGYGCAKYGFEAQSICDSVSRLDKQDSTQIVSLEDVKENKTIGVRELLFERGATDLKKEIRGAV